MINNYDELLLDWSLISLPTDLGKKLANSYSLSELSEKLANKPIPQENDFFRDLDFLSKQMEAVLIEGIKQDENSREFQALFFYYSSQSGHYYNFSTPSELYMDKRDKALEALSGLKKGIDPNNLNDIKKLNDFRDIMSGYMCESSFLVEGIGNFFYIADRFGMLDMLSYEQKSKIESALEIVQVYGLKQGGCLGNSFQLGDAIISWDREFLLNDWAVQIRFLDNPLVFDYKHGYNLKALEALFAIADQKDKQEQERNQTLENTQTKQDFGSQTLESQTLESRQAKKAYDDYKSNPLTPKASKEINDFVNEVIKKAKV
ncbi:MAG: hypothetical protein J1E31_02060 [Helicobacter sp.]|nr:hypothetical protein [Helicobacter sp.]